MNIEYTCIKGKSIRLYKNVRSTEEKPVETPSPIVYPEIDTPEPDFEGYPQEIDYPDYGEDYGLCSELMIGADEQMIGANDQSVDFEIDSKELTSNSVESQITENINDKFSSIVSEVRKDIAENKFLEKFLHYMDLLKVDRENFEDFLIYDLSILDKGFFDPLTMDYQVNDAKVFDRLFELYCPLEAFVIPPKTNLHVKEWLDRLEPDGRYFPKKQLTLFGDG